MTPVTRLMSLIGAVAAAVVTVAIPVIYGAFALGEAKQSLHIETVASARSVEQIILSNPEMWEYQTLRLMEIASKPTIFGEPDERIIRDAAGNTLAHTKYRAPRPLIARTILVYDAGQPVGSVEARRSIRGIVTGAALMGLAGLLLGLSVYIVYRTYPIRMLDRALSELSREKRKSEATLQAIGDGVITVDAGGKIVLINRVAERLLGWPAEAALGTPIEKVYIVRKQKEHVKDGIELRTILQAEEGIERIIEEVRSPIADAAGRPGTVIVFRDVTERLRIEEELIRGRQLESIGLLAAGIAHDFNNFLTGILGNVSLAKVHAAGNARTLARLDEAENASMRARELAQKLLTFAKGGKPARKVFDLRGIVLEASRYAVRGTSVKCVCDAPEGLRNVEADPGQMAQVVNNIVLNAVQAIGGKGTVHIRLENSEIRPAQVTYVKPGSYVMVRIEDSGPGIPGDALPRIFEPYFTTKPAGTGLGLATCYNIMKGHGGNIFAESPPGHGAVFTVYVPATDRTAAAAEEVNAPQPAACGHGRILVMDDEPIIRDLTQEFLTHLGYRVTECRDGEEAVALYAAAADTDAAYDAVIMDLTIPGGMGGKDAADKILARFPDARLIVSSGYSNDPVLADPARYGFRGVVSKPYRIEELGKTVKAVIEGTPPDTAGSPP